MIQNQLKQRRLIQPLFTCYDHVNQGGKENVYQKTLDPLLFLPAVTMLIQVENVYQKAFFYNEHFVGHFAKINAIDMLLSNPKPSSPHNIYTYIQTYTIHIHEEKRDI